VLGQPLRYRSLLIAGLRLDPDDGILPCTTVTDLIDCVTSTAVPLSAAICAGVARPAGQAILTETPQARRGSKIDWTSAAKDALLWVPAGGHGHPVKHLGLAPRRAGLWVVRASI
jgi:hypothetical protein